MIRLNWSMIWAPSIFVCVNFFKEIVLKFERIVLAKFDYSFRCQFVCFLHLALLVNRFFPLPTSPLKYINSNICKRFPLLFITSTTNSLNSYLICTLQLLPGHVPLVSNLFLLVLHLFRDYFLMFLRYFHLIAIDILDLVRFSLSTPL